VSGTVVIAAGGTGGHMFPALALARELRERGRAVALITDRRGARFVESGLHCHLISAASPTGSVGARVAALAALVRGLLQCLVLVVRLRPAAAACFGGYASVAPALAVAAGRRPILLHEQNAVLGRANRMISRLAARVALSFEHTQRTADIAADRLVVVGNPVRPEFGAQPARYIAPRPDAPVRLLVLGGSQGARVFSDVLPAAIGLLPGALRGRLRIRQQCRPEDLERVREAYAAIGVAAELAAFFDDMPRLLGEADLLVSRSGASTIAEIITVGRPAVLVPYAHAADDHQRVNAEHLAHAGAAEMLIEHGLTPGALAERLTACLDDPQRLDRMAMHARAMARPDAAQRLADALLALVPAEGRA
jgi:UDP-N-acetylglucosamine--N-acetylmuramyl-(pentapeptide) pyrophosphoryl-undecaprenol N-acetylglucosamine transferase